MMLLKALRYLDAVLETIRFALAEPVTLGFFPYFPTDSANVDLARAWTKRYLEALGGGSDGETFDNDSNKRKKAIDLLTTETEEVHRKASVSLKQFSHCTHDGIEMTSFPCLPCYKVLDQEGKALNKQNKVMGFVMLEVSRAGRRAPMLSRTACSILYKLIEVKLTTLEKYKVEAALKMDKSVSAYWRQYGHFSAQLEAASNEANIVDDSTFVFPGRKQLRPAIMMDGKDKADCTKKYYTSRPNMTSFISLQCPCSHPKIIGFSLIKEVESIAMAISTVAAFLNFPPHTVW